MSDQTTELEQPEDETEDDYALRNRVVVAAVDAAEAGDRPQLEAVLEPLHPADIADLLEQVDEDERNAILKIAGDYIDGEILSEINEDIRDRVIEALEPDVLAAAVQELESDDVVDLLEDLEDHQQEAILESLDVVDRIAVEQALAYPNPSTGAWVRPSTICAPMMICPSNSIMLSSSIPRITRWPM